jgi:exodeoxyribonuclease V gamma subunit
MGRLVLHTSNRLERLADSLASVLAERPLKPLAPEVLATQNRGMARWLSHAIAERCGIAMNLRSLLPKQLADELLGSFFPGETASPDLLPEALVWTLHRLIDELQDDPAMADARLYLDAAVAGERQQRRHEFAWKVAGLFDQYLFYRPKLLAQWERSGSAGDWQALLWRETLQELGNPPRLPEQLERLRQEPERIAAAGCRLPERISLFAPSSLPPIYLELLQAAARVTEIHLFLLQPTDLYWGDAFPARVRDRLLSRASTKAGRPIDAEELNLSQLHPLVENLGGQARDLHNLVLDLDRAEDQPNFEPPKANTLLGRLQADIFALRRGSGEEEEEQAEAAALFTAASAGTDRSLRIVSAHSPLREVERLRDVLLDLFARDRTLRPRDVLVMTPDIETYAPRIRAVFGAPEDGETNIPFNIADRRPRAASPAIDAFFALLELPGSRLSARSVVAMLEMPALRERFGLGPDELARIRSWVAAAGIRWGRNAAHRELATEVAFSEGSWEAGLDRLLLGYATSSTGCETWRGVVPFDEMEGSGAAVLGPFASAAGKLLAIAENLSAPRSLSAWAHALASLVRDFLPESDDHARDLRQLRLAFAALRHAEESGAFTGEVDLATLRCHLSSTLAETVGGGGFLSGGVTFCALKPMRSVPARVICLLGMDSQSFPRRGIAPSFDKIAAEPQPGDRSPRGDDRMLLLETLLAARELLYVSYVGQSLRDSKPMPPSTLVSELLDAIWELRPTNAEAEPLTREGWEDRFVLRLPLQPFSPAAFRAPSDARQAAEHFSYSREDAAAARQLANGMEAPRIFIRDPLPVPPADQDEAELRLETLIRFFGDAVGTFLRDRLGLRIEDYDEPLGESELLDLDGLSLYAARQRLLEQSTEIHRAMGSVPAFASEGLLPPRAVGQVRAREVQRETAEFTARCAERRMGDQTWQAIDFQIEGRRLTGSVGPIHSNRLVLARFGKLRGKDRLGGWIQHLALCSVLDQPISTLFIDLENVTAFRPLPADEARAHLSALVGLRDLGLRQPLLLFPNSSFAFAQAWIKAANESERRRARYARLAALKAWEGDRDPDSSKPAARMALAGRDPMDGPDYEQFCELARAVFGPLVNALTKPDA